MALNLTISHAEVPNRHKNYIGVAQIDLIQQEGEISRSHYHRVRFFAGLKNTDVQSLG